MTTTIFKSTPVGVFATGLSVVGYALFNADGSANGGRVAAGVVERPAGSSRYVTSVAFPVGFAGDLRWDDAGAPTTHYFIDTVDISQMAAVKVKTDLIGTASVTYTTPVTGNASATIVQGDDYLGARALSWTVNDYSGPDLTGATVECGLMALVDYNENPAASPAFTVTGSLAITTASDLSTTIIYTVPIASAVTSALSPAMCKQQYNYLAQVVAIDAQGHRQTPLLVAMTVERRIV